MTTQPSSDALLNLVNEVARELHPHRPPEGLPGLDQRLDEELGFDSLGLAELYGRAERTFGVHLPDQALSSVQTPRDLLRALSGAESRPGGAPPKTKRPAPLEAVETAPDEAKTLLDVLDWQVAHNGDRPFIELYGDADEPEQITYTQLYERSARLAAGLQEQGLQAGHPVAIMLPTSGEYLYSFFGTLMAGGIPVPIYPPVRPAQIEDHLTRHVGILNNAETRILITVPVGKTVGYLLRARVPSLQAVATPEELAATDAEPQFPVLGSGDIAFLQYTSGSTGTPKGVVLTHANLLANVRAMGRSGRVDSTDVLVSWLPLYHDMGLIGAVFGSLYFSMLLVLLSPIAFLNRPERWLWAIHRHRGTITASPNFGYELCLRRVQDADLKGLDLSSLRFAVNGAEPVSVETMRQFHERFEPFGLRRGAVAPVYGLAESAVGLAFSPPGREPLVDAVQREPFLQRGEARPADPDDPTALKFVACGQPLAGHEIRVVDESGREVGERHEGRLQFRGPSSTLGYYRNPEETKRLFDGDWVNSGDLAYIAEGDVYLTGREKDVIIRAGRNLYPYELEEAVGNLEGIRKGCVAVFGSPDPQNATERLVIVAETRARAPEARRPLEERIEAVSMELMGTVPDDIVLAPPHTVLKTSSGKIRRSATRALYERGVVGRSHRAPWLQVARVAAAGVIPQIRRWMRVVSSTAYAVYWWLVVLLVAVVAWPLVVLVPIRAWAWFVTRLGSRIVLAANRIPLRVEGRERLPREGPRLYISNHASYLDGLVLVLSLPGRLRFVAKQELAAQFVAGPFLRRLGTEFVERFDKQRGLADARRLATAGQADEGLVFFPEGTFTRVPGLRAFHMGAFVVAAEAGVPLVPVALRGTRSVLRDNTWFPRRGRVSVHIGEPIMPDGRDWSAAIGLRDAARQRILRMCGEPDLAPHAEAP